MRTAIWCGPRIVPLVNLRDGEGESSIWGGAGHVLMAPGHRLHPVVFRVSIGVSPGANRNEAA